MTHHPSSQHVRICPRQKRHRHVLLPLLVAALLAASAAGLRGWEDEDAGTSAWNSDSSWDRGGSQSFTSTRQPGSAGTKAAGDGVVSPPSGPARIGHNGGSAVKNHNKYKQKPKVIGPQPGFSGGFLPKTHRCANPALPGCQSCTGDTCTACYEDLGDASFELSTETNQCVCPAGYGKIAEADLPIWWAGRRLMQIPGGSSSSSNTSSSDIITALLSSSSSGSSNSTILLWNMTSEEQQQQEEGREAVMPMAMGVPIPPPVWATDCLPCPVDFYSSGGPVGFAECRVCPAGWTTGNATAAADCLVPYCAPGQEVNRRTGRCRSCPFGTYRSAGAANQTCSVCPKGFTTASRGSTSMADCRVPICTPGQQLDIDLFICKNCMGNTISPGGVRANGPFQPFCQECPTFTAAVNRTLCLDEACPQPEAFSITCRQDAVPSCGPGSKPFLLDNYCTAYPVGSQIQWVRAAIELDQTTNTTSYSVNNQNFTIPAVADCPAGAFGTNVWYPFIVAFKGRTNCLCTDKTSCRFASVGQSSTAASASFNRFNSTINITIHDPQLSSLRRLLFSMNRANYTEYGSRLGAYCTPDSTKTNGLQTSCLGPYLYNITYAPSNINGFIMMNGTLPPAVQLPGLNHLQAFTCAGCNLRGTFPPDWGTSNNLLALRHLDLGTNAFTGTLPESWGGLVNLVNLTLSSNGYVGPVPSFWGNMRSLAYANLTQLQVDGSSCLPTEWQVRNGLLPGTTLLTNGGQPFC